MSLPPRLDRSEKNYILNSNFNIWQRGTSFPNGLQYNADRFYSTVATLTYQRAEVQSPNFNKYCLRVTGNGSLDAGLAQRLESINVRELAGRTVMFSFYAKTSAVGENISIKIREAATEDDWSVASSVVADTTIGSSTTGWSRYSYSFTVSAAMAMKGFGIEVYSAALSNSVDLDLADWMLSQGDYLPDYAPAFDQPAAELVACMRYTEKIQGGHRVLGRDASAVNIAIQFSVPKRTSPDVFCQTLVSGFHILDFSGVNQTNGNTTTNLISRSLYFIQFYMTGYTGLTTNRSYLPNSGADGAFFIVDAEL